MPKTERSGMFKHGVQVRVWCHMPVISVPKRLRQDNHEFEDSIGYSEFQYTTEYKVTLCFVKNNNNKNRTRKRRKRKRKIKYKTRNCWAIFGKWIPHPLG